MPNDELMIPHSDESDVALMLYDSESTGTFFPNIRLLQGLSPAVEQGKGVAGDFLFDGKINLGKLFKAYVLGSQPHALRLEGGKIVAQSYTRQTAMIVDPFDPSKRIPAITGDPVFKEIHDAEDTDTVANLWGEDVLVYINDYEVFGVLGLLKKSSRKHFKDFDVVMKRQERESKPLAAQISSEYIKLTNINRQWHEPHCVPCKDDETYRFPNPEAVKNAIDKFLDHGDAKVETVKEDNR